jgi:indole-3-glycerol phosphate synthase
LEELERALLLPTPLLGINNRSLHTFKTDLHCSIELNKLIPDDRITISESGINTRQDIELLQAHGIDTYLIGESLMRENDIGLKLRNFLGK